MVSWTLVDLERELRRTIATIARLEQLLDSQRDEAARTEQWKGVRKTREHVFSLTRHKEALEQLYTSREWTTAQETI